MIGVLRRTVVSVSTSQDCNHPDDLFQSRYAIPGFKPFSYFLTYWACFTYTRVKTGLGLKLTKAEGIYKTLLA